MKKSAYHREIKPGVWVDVYDVLRAFEITDPALQHAIKKQLALGKRGMKDLLQDLGEAIWSLKNYQEAVDPPTESKVETSKGIHPLWLKELQRLMEKVSRGGGMAILEPQNTLAEPFSLDLVLREGMDQDCFGQPLHREEGEEVWLGVAGERYIVHTAGVLMTKASFKEHGGNYRPILKYRYRDGQYRLVSRIEK